MGLVAQDKPDFSGRWVLQDPPQPGVDIPRAWRSISPSAEPQRLGEPMPPAFLDLSVERQFESRVPASRPITSGRRVAPLGASSETAVLLRTSTGLQSRVSVRWEGDPVPRSKRGATRDRRTVAGQYAEHTEVWRLDEQGRLTITVVDRRSDAEVATRTLTYRRQ